MDIIKTILFLPIRVINFIVFGIITITISVPTALLFQFLPVLISAGLLLIGSGYAGEKYVSEETASALMMISTGMLIVSVLGFKVYNEFIDDKAGDLIVILNSPFLKLYVVINRVFATPPSVTNYLGGLRSNSASITIFSLRWVLLLFFNVTLYLKGSMSIISKHTRSVINEGKGKPPLP